jgi:hypothetical protein
LRISRPAKRRNKDKGEISKKKIAPRTIGLVNFDKKIPNWNQSLLSGFNKLGQNRARVKKEVNATIQTIDNETLLELNLIYKNKNKTEKNNPKFWLLGSFSVFM